MPKQRTDRVVLEAHLGYWSAKRFPRLQRIVFDNTLSQQEALALIKANEGRVDLLTGLSPLETLRVAQSPFAKVVKDRTIARTMFGFFNMRKAGTPWRDIRLRQAINYAINREHLIRYGARGNGVIVPALLGSQMLGNDHDLAPYPFAPTKARQLLREAGYPDGLALILVARKSLAVQATVVSKMLEQVGFTVELQLLDTNTYHQMTFLSEPDQPPELQPWDIALTSRTYGNFPVLKTYHRYALGGVYDWLIEEPELRHLYDQVLGTGDLERRRVLIDQMERHTHAQAYFLFLYKPIRLYAVNKEVAFVPYATRGLRLYEAAVTERHWSVRKQ